MKKNILTILVFFSCIASFAQKDGKELPESLKTRLNRTQAEFPGGPEKMKKFLDKHKRYQNKEHKRYGVGIVYVGFIVEKDGSIDSVQLLQPLNSYYDKEAIRIVKAMPRWTPATENGQPLRTQFRFPIKF
jgi:protein TonB